MTRLKLGLMIFPGFEMLDAYGPLEMCSMHQKLFEIFAIGPSLDPVKTNSGGPATMPDLTFENATQMDILLVPGGTGWRDVVSDQSQLDWLRGQAERAQWVTSVCTGSLILAAAGLLDGKRATTNKMAFPRTTPAYPAVHWQPSARWVVDGKFLTSSGVSAGMDMALDLIARIAGPEAAEQAAHWAEYTRNPDPDHDPFAVEAP
ncbi:MAG: DJ-1/PfpI family protein [Pseudomonadota bacterium]